MTSIARCHAPGPLTCVALALALSSCEVGEPAVLDLTGPEIPVNGADRGDVGIIGTVVWSSERRLRVQQGQSIALSPELERLEAPELIFPLGMSGDMLDVVLIPDTRIFSDGGPATFDPLSPGMLVLVRGDIVGDQLEARVVANLTALIDYDTRREDLLREALAMREPLAVSPSPALSEIQAFDISRCRGQSMNFGPGPLAVQTAVFQGCYGGPSSNGAFRIPNVPLKCFVEFFNIKCFVLAGFAYNVGLGGWSFAFPFEFSAPTGTLTYHETFGTVPLKVRSLPGPPGTLTFQGGYGFRFALELDECPIGAIFTTHTCEDVVTVPVSALSIIHEGTSEAPLPGQRYNVKTTSCINTLFPLPGVIGGIVSKVISLGLCQNWAMNGDDLTTRVSSTGGFMHGGPASFDLGVVDRNITLTPEAPIVDLTLDQFEWTPVIEMDWSVRLDVLGTTLWQSPTVDVGAGALLAVTTPFPSNSQYALARDPSTPLTAPAFLDQPASVTLRLPVNPAPTRLSIVSPPILPEGTPVQVVLLEAHTGAPISGHSVAFDVGGSITTSVTDEEGVVVLLLPVGKHDVRVSFAGSVVYVPSRDAQAPLSVYRTTPRVLVIDRGLVGQSAAFRAEWTGPGALLYAWDVRPMNPSDGANQFGELAANAVDFLMPRGAAPYPAEFKVWEKRSGGGYQLVGAVQFTVP